MRTWKPRKLPTSSAESRDDQLRQRADDEEREEDPPRVARGTDERRSATRARQLALRILRRARSARARRSESAMVIGETNGMSVIACRVISAHCDDVASTSAASAPARRPASRATSCHTAQIDGQRQATMSGRRTAHSARQIGDHLVRRRVRPLEAEQLHRQRHQPEGEHRLGPELRRDLAASPATTG